MNKSILHQTSLLYRVIHLNTTRQALLPFSTSVRYLAESTDDPSGGKSFDSVRKYL